MNYEAMGNNELLGHFAKTRDKAAFEIFYKRNDKHLRGFLFVMCYVLSREIADCSQSVWTRVIEKAHLYDPEQSAINWLNALAKNVKNGLYQQSTKLRRGGTDTDHYSLGDKRFDDDDLITDHRSGQTVSDPSTRMVKEEQRQQIHEAIEKLRPPYKEAVTLVLLRGIPYDEAAEMVGVTPGMMAQRLNRGKTSLHRLLSSRKDELATK